MGQFYTLVVWLGITSAKFFTDGKGFLNLTYSKCAQIPHENDFTKRVVREDRTLNKRGTRPAARGRRIGYFIVAKLVCHGRDIRKKLRLEKLTTSLLKLRLFS